MPRYRFTLGIKVWILSSVILCVTTAAQYAAMRICGHRFDGYDLSVVLGVLITISIPCLWYASQFIVRDLNRLRDAALNMARQPGIRFPEIRVWSTDQVGDLAGAFNTLSAVIHEQVERYEAVQRMAGDGIITIYREPEGSRVRSFNPAAQTMFGVLEQDVVSRQYRELIERFVPSLEDRARVEHSS
jgi:hypothetical protein